MGRRTGRLVKLTPEAVKTIVKYVAAGVPMKFAAPHAGVSARAVTYWLARGRKEKAGGTFASFVAAVKKAESEAVAVRLLRINMAGAGGAVVKSTTTVTEPDGKVTTTVVLKAARAEWTADAWHLERTFPEVFGTNRREIAELRRRLNQIEADRGLDASRKEPPEKDRLPPVERDDGPGGDQPADEVPG